MPVVHNGKKQYIVSLDTMLTWKHFENDHAHAKIVGDDSDGGKLFVQGSVQGKTKSFTIDGKQLIPV